MTKRTFAYLRDQWDEKPPQDYQDDLLESIFEIGSAIFVSPDGDDSNTGNRANPYATIQKGLDEVTASKNVVFVMPGTYGENLTWPTLNGAYLIGAGKNKAVTVDGPDAGGTAVLKIAPATNYSSEFKAFLENLHLKHAGTGLAIDNDGHGSAAPFSVYGKHVSFGKDGGTSIKTAHNGSAAMKLYLEGAGEQIEGEAYLAIENGSDVARFDGMRLSSGLQTSAGSAFGGTAEITLVSAEVLHEGVTGGHADQRINSLFSWSKTGETYATLDTNDLAGSHTENIIN